VERFGLVRSKIRIGLHSIKVLWYGFLLGNHGKHYVLTEIMNDGVLSGADEHVVTSIEIGNLTSQHLQQQQPPSDQHERREITAPNQHQITPSPANKGNIPKGGRLISLSLNMSLYKILLQRFGNMSI
jgi:hypothetical protein